MKQDSKIVYLACPYSHEDEDVREKRYRTTTQIAMQLARGGYRVFSPITHAHPISKRDPRVPRNWDFWQLLDGPIIEISAVMVVLMMDGWAQSVGLHEEIQVAMNHGIPILYASYADFPTVEDLLEKWDYLGILKEENRRSDLQNEILNGVRIKTEGMISMGIRKKTKEVKDGRPDSYDDEGRPKYSK